MFLSIENQFLLSIFERCMFCSSVYTYLTSIVVLHSEIIWKRITL